MNKIKDLSIVIATLNEQDNIEQLFQEIFNTIPRSLNWELILLMSGVSPPHYSSSGMRFASGVLSFLH